MYWRISVVFSPTVTYFYYHVCLLACLSHAWKAFSAPWRILLFALLVQWAIVNGTNDLLTTITVSTSRTWAHITIVFYEDWNDQHDQLVDQWMTDICALYLSFKFIPTTIPKSLIHCRENFLNDWNSVERPFCDLLAFGNTSLNSRLLFALWSAFRLFRSKSNSSMLQMLRRLHISRLTAASYPGCWLYLLNSPWISNQNTLETSLKGPVRLEEFGFGKVFVSFIMGNNSLPLF